MDRSRYPSDRVACQDHAVEPENRLVARYEQLHNHQELLAWKLQPDNEQMTTLQIAGQLTEDAWRPPKRRRPFNGAMVRALLSRRASPRPPPRAHASDTLFYPPEWWLGDLAQRLATSLPARYSWLRGSWGHARQLPGAQCRRILWADEDELQRLQQLRRCPQTWSEQSRFPQLTPPKLRAEDK